jgi:hypothetical protein
MLKQLDKLPILVVLFIWQVENLSSLSCQYVTIFLVPKTSTIDASKKIHHLLVQSSYHVAYTSHI